MANDIIFKSKAFGGFDKNEVMDFVNKILEEKASLEKKLSESNAKFAQTNAQLFELKQTLDEAESEKAELDLLKAQLQEAQSIIINKDEELSSITSQLSDKNNENESLKNELSKAVTSDEVNAELDALRSEVARLKVEADKKRDLERQVGLSLIHI